MHEAESDEDFVTSSLGSVLTWLVPAREAAEQTDLRSHLILNW